MREIELFLRYFCHYYGVCVCVCVSWAQARAHEYTYITYSFGSIAAIRKHKRRRGDCRRGFRDRSRRVYYCCSLERRRRSRNRKRTPRSERAAPSRSWSHAIGPTHIARRRVESNQLALRGFVRLFDPDDFGSLSVLTSKCCQHSRGPVIGPLSTLNGRIYNRMC